MPTDPLRLMCVLAHPDDESMGVGATLAKYADEGVEISLVTATRGERGWGGPADEYPGAEALGRIRQAELLEAAKVLGICHVEFLDYLDGDLDQADPLEAAAKIAASIRRERPQIVITFEPFGAYGHPDHIAISQLTTAATVLAADPTFQNDTTIPHRVSKLYYSIVSKALYDAWLGTFGDINMPVDGVTRGAVAWVDWAITTQIDGASYWRKAWEAVCCHKSQLSGLGDLERLTNEQQAAVWGDQAFYRAFSLVNGGRKLETDLFEGLRRS